MRKLAAMAFGYSLIASRLVILCSNSDARWARSIVSVKLGIRSDICASISSLMPTVPVIEGLRGSTTSRSAPDALISSIVVKFRYSGSRRLNRKRR
ncbi:hypothetical protein BJX63DRAFT_416223 [Aspergillus granulosus]|uniref:Secreted protein n=1 Tax=Aspergillus granulosus TaxID=176169 RepID=A0ABR4GTW2_9EURO